SERGGPRFSPVGQGCGEQTEAIVPIPILPIFDSSIRPIKNGYLRVKFYTQTSLISLVRCGVQRKVIVYLPRK
ncbi:hypothetical protein SERLADRAFT_381292, partial [Serpula lacrymans var. lacrymans S7.9]